MSRNLPTKRLLASAALTVSLSLSTVAAQTPHWQQSQYIIDSFVTIALEREHGPNTAMLTKWHKPIQFYIDDRTADMALHKRMVEQQLQHLAAITGLSITAAKNTQQANLKIIFSSELQLDSELKTDLGVHNNAFRQEILKNSVCLGRIAVDARGQISNAQVLIPVDRARAHAKLMACVVEELTQVLGLVNDSSDVYPSIFNDRSFNDFLSGLDYLLLKTLYHPELRAGMERSQVKKSVSEIVHSPSFQSQIGHAETAVRRGSLENWLD